MQDRADVYRLLLALRVQAIEEGWSDQEFADVASDRVYRSFERDVGALVAVLDEAGAPRWLGDRPAMLHERVEWLVTSHTVTRSLDQLATTVAYAATPATRPLGASMDRSGLPNRDRTLHERVAGLDQRVTAIAAAVDQLAAAERDRVASLSDATNAPRLTTTGNAICERFANLMFGIGAVALAVLLLVGGPLLYLHHVDPFAGIGDDFIRIAERVGAHNLVAQHPDLGWVRDGDHIVRGNERVEIGSDRYCELIPSPGWLMRPAVIKPCLRP